MKNELVLEDYEVQKLSHQEESETKGGAVILVNRGWMAIGYAIADGIHDIYKGWTARHEEVNTTW